MSHQYYPVALDLNERPCVVVGGGPLALEKIEGLLRAGALVTAVHPHVVPGIDDLARLRYIVLRRRVYRSGDLHGIYLAYGASEDRALNDRVAMDARNAGVIVNAVDDIPNCDFFAMALLRRGDLQLAVSTNGRSPAFARWMREYLEERVPKEFGDLLSLLGDIRLELKEQGNIPPYETWHRAISEDALLLLRRGDIDGARQRLLAVLAPSVSSRELEQAS